jgi:hypothetical protein
MAERAGAISFAARAKAAEGVLFRELAGEAVLLSLGSETYFGLDEVGTRMWNVLNASPSIQAAFDLLLEEYDVDEPQLRHDLEAFLAELLERKLVEICEATPG